MKSDALADERQHSASDIVLSRVEGQFVPEPVGAWLDCAGCLTHHALPFWSPTACSSILRSFRAREKWFGSKMQVVQPGCDYLE